MLKPNSGKDSDEFCFSDFEAAYKQMGDEFAQVIALEEVEEIFEHFRQSPPADKDAKQIKGSSKSKDKSTSESGAAATPLGKKTRADKIKIGEFIRTVSQGSQ